VAVVTVLLVPVAVAGAQAADDGDGDVPAGELRDAYVQALEEEAATYRRYEEASLRVLALEEEITALDGAIADAEAELAAAEAELAAAEAELASTERRLARAEAALADQQARFREQAVAAYIGGGSDTVPVFAGALRHAADLNDLATSRVYGRAVVLDRKQVVARFDELRSQAAALRAEADAGRDLAAGARAVVAARVADLEAQRSERRAAQEAAAAAAAEQAALAAELDQRRRDFELRYAATLTSADSIAALLRERQRNQLPATSTFGILLNPVEGGPVVSAYGLRLHPILGIERMHKGLDIDGPMGAPVRASADGVVVFAEERGGYGLTVLVDHGNQLATLYAHLSSFAVGPGDPVRRGDVLGTVGSTGLSTGPHVHWEVRVLGTPVSGLPYLAREPR
jgi:murein DD-endopeptidase MepM/ murein hydrolase activator NlpD